MIGKDSVIIIILFIVSAALQLILVPMISVYGVYPDMLVLPIIFFTLKKGQIYGTMLGFAFGFIFDFISGGVLGSAMFAYTLVGFAAGYFYDETRLPSEINVLMIFSIIFIGSTISSFFYSALGTNNLGEIFNSLFVFSISCGIYSTVISIPLILLKPFKLIE